MTGFWKLVAIIIGLVIVLRVVSYLLAAAFNLFINLVLPLAIVTAIAVVLYRLISKKCCVGPHRTFH